MKYLAIIFTLLILGVASPIEANDLKRLKEELVQITEELKDPNIPSMVRDRMLMNQKSIIEICRN